MFIDKVKVAAAILALTAVSVAATSGALLAFQSPKSKSVSPSAGTAARPASTAQNQQSGAADTKQKDDDEAAGERLDELHAEAERLELECEADRTLIREQLQASVRIQSELDRLDYRPINDEDRNAIKSSIERFSVRAGESQKRLAELKQQYTLHQRALAQAKRRRVFAAQTLGLAVDYASSPSELTSRLDRLEAKLDRIINALTVKGIP
jgi:hypothetical protein